MASQHSGKQTSSLTCDTLLTLFFQALEVHIYHMEETRKAFLFVSNAL